MYQDVRLFIGDKEVELSADPKLLLNFKETELHNPTIVKNYFTKTIEIEGTNANNDIFGQIWNLDRYQYYGSGGAGFNPIKKAPFQLFVGGDLYEKGYVKLDNVVRANNSITYSITLFGGLGDFFYNLSYDQDNESDVKKTLIPCRYPSLDEKSDDRNKSSYIKSSLLNQPELEKKWDTEYLCWRFLSTENPEYAFVNDQDTFAIAVVGIRGKVTKDVQILMMATKNEKVLSNHCKKNVADKLNELFHPDTISCVDNDHFLIFGNTIGALHTIPVCYKWTEGAESLNITNLVHTVIKYNLQ